MVMIVCGKYENNRSRTENVTERTRFSKSRSNDLEDIGQGQRSSHATHLLMLVIVCTKYGKTPSRTVDATERTWFSRSRPKVITCDTPSHAINHLYQIWKESILNCRCYKADAGRMDGRTDGRSETNIPSTTLLCGGYKNLIEDQFQWSPKLVGIWTVLRCIFVPNLEIITSIGGELWHRQAQNGVNFDFGVQFDLEGHNQLSHKTIGILTKVFYISGPNLVILA